MSNLVTLNAPPDMPPMGVFKDILNNSHHLDANHQVTVDLDCCNLREFLHAGFTVAKTVTSEITTEI